MDQWEEVNIWSYIGLIFMAVTSIGMLSYAIWMCTW